MYYVLTRHVMFCKINVKQFLLSDEHVPEIICCCIFCAGAYRLSLIHKRPAQFITWYCTGVSITKWRNPLVYLKKVRIIVRSLLIHILYNRLTATECPEDKYLNRHVVNEVAAACTHQPDIWRDLGIELLGQDGATQLDVIKASNTDNVTKCCSEMLALWRQRQTKASWNLLMGTLSQVKLNRVAKEIEKRLKTPTNQEDKVGIAMQATKITPAQKQAQQVKQDDLHKESNVTLLTKSCALPTNACFFCL